MRHLTSINVISITVILAIAYYITAEKKEPVIRKRPIVDTYLDLEQVPEGTAPASLGNRIPYHAIDDIPSKMDSKLSTVTASYCRSVDTTAALEKTGNFRQITNNFKRGSPDSCSAPNQELVLAFYDIKPVNIIGN